MNNDTHNQNSRPPSMHRGNREESLQNPFDDTSDSFIRTGSHAQDELALLPPKLSPPSWSSYRRNIRCGESEMVQVTIWERGDEQIITLQWLDRDQTGIWRPRNVPPIPSALL